jgi:hypothetical protein
MALAFSSAVANEPLYQVLAGTMGYFCLERLQEPAQECLSVES